MRVIFEMVQKRLPDAKGSAKSTKAVAVGTVADSVKKAHGPII